MSALGDRMRRLFGSSEDDTTPAADHDEADKRLAAAALLVETAVMDGDFDEAERATVATLTTRIRIAWGVIGLLCVALGVVGVFG